MKKQFYALCMSFASLLYAPDPIQLSPEELKTFAEDKTSLSPRVHEYLYSKLLEEVVSEDLNKIPVFRRNGEHASIEMVEFRTTYAHLDENLAIELKLPSKEVMFYFSRSTLEHNPTNPKAFEKNGRGDLKLWIARNHVDTIKTPKTIPQLILLPGKFEVRFQGGSHDIAWCFPILKPDEKSFLQDDDKYIQINNIDDTGDTYSIKEAYLPKELTPGAMRKFLSMVGSVSPFEQIIEQTS